MTGGNPRGTRPPGGSGMKIVVVGAGAVGGYFGGRLAAAGESVTFLCRGAVKEAIDKNGLRIDSVAGNAHVRPPTVERPDASFKTDVVVWAVKAYHNREAMETARPVVGDRTEILCLQNGLDAADDLAAAFGADRVIGGFASIAAEAVEPGVVRHTAMGRVTIGELRGQSSDRVTALSAHFEKAGIPHAVSADIRRDIWGKLVWNAAFNPLSVILRASVGDLLNNLAALSILKRAMDETVAVAKSEGYTLSPKLIEAYLDPKDASAEFRTSMLQDFLRGRPMETDAISGAVVRRARRLKISVPVNEFFYDALRYWAAAAPAAKGQKRNGDGSHLSTTNIMS